MKKIEIKWRDSHRYTYQMHPEEEILVTIITSCGYLVRENRHQIVICQDLINEDIRGVMAIPRENVLSIKKL